MRVCVIPLFSRGCRNLSEEYVKVGRRRRGRPQCIYTSPRFSKNQEPSDDVWAYQFQTFLKHPVCTRYDQSTLSSRSGAMYIYYIGMELWNTFTYIPIQVYNCRKISFIAFLSFFYFWYSPPPYNAHFISFPNCFFLFSIIICIWI